MRYVTLTIFILAALTFYACGDTPSAPTPPVAFIQVVMPRAGANFSAEWAIKIVWRTNHPGQFDVWIIRVDAAADLRQKVFESVPAGDIIWRNWKVYRFPAGNYVIRVETRMQGSSGPVASGDSGVFSLP